MNHRWKKVTIIQRRYRERTQKQMWTILDFAVWVGWRHLSGEVGTRGQLLPRFIQQCSRDRDRATRNP